MINANELRIGNLVLISGKVAVLDVIKFSNLLDIGYSFIPNPIKLTSGLWVKLGFEQKESRKAITFDEFSLSFIKNSHNDGYTLGYFKEGSFFGVSTNIYYVHHVQNIYHSITGEELDVSKISI